jgi:transcriptional regulator with XRE-family HTH domain
VGNVKSGFGSILSEWRSLRRASQLDLALATGVSQRHISFIESGRAQPSRELILKLAGGLDLPLRTPK